MLVILLCNGIGIAATFLILSRLPVLKNDNENKDVVEIGGNKEFILINNQKFKKLENIEGRGFCFK